MAESNNLPPTADQQAKGFFAKNKVTFILLLVLALSNAGIYFFQNSKLNQLKTSIEEKQQEKVAQVNGLLTYRTETSTQALGKAITFATGPEMASNDKQRLNLFFIDMVQNTEAELISVVDSIGMIYLSTDKNYEGKSVLDVLPALPGRIDQPTVQKINEDEFLYAAPVTYGRRVGTCVMSFKTDPKTHKLVEEINTPHNFE